MEVQKDTLLGFGIIDIYFPLKNNLRYQKEISRAEVFGLFLDERWNLWKLIMKKSFRPPGFSTSVDNMRGGGGLLNIW